VEGIKMTRKISLVLTLIILCFATLSAPLPAPVYAQTETDWIETAHGIDGGWVKVLAIHPGDSNILYAGTRHGIYKTYDAASTWQPVNQGFPRYQVQTIKVDPVNPSRVYVATIENGVYISENDGESWQAKNEGLEDLQIYSLAIDPNVPAILFAGAESGIFKSEDFGETWAKVHSSSAICQIVFNPLDSSIVFAAACKYGSLYKSVDGGLNWEYTSIQRLSGVHTFAVDPTDPDRFYLVGEGRAVRTMDGGETFINFPYLQDGGYTFSLDPQNPAVLYLFRENKLHISQNYGEDWESYVMDPPFRSQFLLIDPNDNQVMYLACPREGIQKSIDSGQTWFDAHKNITAHEVTALAFDRSRLDWAYAGTSNGILYKSEDGGAHWQLLTDQFKYRSVVSLATSGGETPSIYLGTASSTDNYRNGATKIHKSEDFGETWIEITPELIYAPVKVMDIVINPDKASWVYMATENGVFKSMFSGKWWVYYELAEFYYSQYFTRVAIDPVNTNIVYTTGINCELFKSEEDGRNFKRIAEGLFFGSGYYADIVIDPVDPDILYFLADSKVFKSGDGGETWRAFIGEGHLSYALKLHYDPGTETLYIFERGGRVFSISANGDNFQNITSNLPVQSPYCLVDNPHAAGSVFVCSTASLYKTQGIELEHKIHVPLVLN